MGMPIFNGFFFVATVLRFATASPYKYMYRGVDGRDILRLTGSPSHHTDLAPPPLLFTLLPPTSGTICREEEGGIFPLFTPPLLPGSDSGARTAGEGRRGGGRRGGKGRRAHSLTRYSSHYRDRSGGPER